MGFFVGDQTKLVRGAARILVAPAAQAKPTDLADVINLTTYAAVSGWEDLGYTRQGIAISVNNSEQGFDVDQVPGLIGAAPIDWSCTVVTQLAEPTLENMILVWEGATMTTDTVPSIDEEETGFAGATAYTERRVAVMFQRPNLRITGFFFHRMVRTPQEGTLNFQKTGDAQTLPLSLQALADDTEVDPKMAFFRVRRQVDP